MLEFAQGQEKRAAYQQYITDTVFLHTTNITLLRYGLTFPDFVHLGQKVKY